MRRVVNSTKFIDLSLTFCYALGMPEKSYKNFLLLKIGLLVLLGIFIPSASIIFPNNLNLPNLLIAIVVGSISFAIAMFLISITLKPLRSLLKGTDSLGDGNLNARIDIRSKDEFEEVSNSFNLMAEKLAQNFQKLEQDKNLIATERNKLDAVLSSMNNGVIALDLSGRVVFVNKAAEYITGYSSTEIQGKSVQDFVHLYVEKQEVFSKIYCQEGYNQPGLLVGKMGLQKKVNVSTTATTTEGMQTNISCILILHDLAREEELEKMKFDFVSMASHELKTPLTNIIGYLSVFVNENRNKIQKEEMNLLERCLTSAKGLFSLVENILNVNKIERDKFNVEIVESDYANILTKTVEDIQNPAKLKNITLILSPIPNLPKALLDPLRITEVVNNLIGNAINYTNSGGSINVSVKTTPTEIITCIADTGVGIPKEAIPYLFNKFFRVSNTKQQASKGTGLGLFIAKSIIEKLNGKIWVESEEGKGSKFYFSLPIASQAEEKINSQNVVSETIQAGALNY